MKKLIILLCLIFIPALTASDTSTYVLAVSGQDAGGTPSEYTLCEEVTESLGANYANETMVRGNSCVTDATGGTLTKICAHYNIVDSSVNGFKMVVSKTSSGDPSGQDIVAQVVGTLTPDTTGVYCVDVSGSPQLDGSTEYYVGIVTEDADDRYSYTNSATGASAWYATESSYSAAFSDPMIAGYTETANRQWSVWAVYEH